MLLIDLFDRDNILCPEWLTQEFLEDEWEDSSYSFHEGYHSWILETVFGTSRICFNGNEFHFQSLSDDGEWIPFKTIMKDDIIIY